MRRHGEFKLSKLCELVNQLSCVEFKKKVISNLKWYGIPRTWKLTDVEDFYNKHKEKV